MMLHADRRTQRAQSSQSFFFGGLHHYNVLLRDTDCLRKFRAGLKRNHGKMTAFSKKSINNDCNLKKYVYLCAQMQGCLFHRHFL